MNLRELLREASRQLADADVEIPEQTARWLWQSASGMPAHQVVLNQYLEADEAQEAAFLTLVERRARREPLQYVLAEAEFAGLSLYVDRRVLVPRPETEGLVALAKAEIESRLKMSPGRRQTVLDLGAGSGAIVVALGVAFRESRSVHLTATDLSSDALEVARINARRYELEDRIEFRGGDGFAALAAGEETVPPIRIDVLISNPPYIPLNDAPLLEPEVRDYEPHLALFAGRDGLDAYRMIAKNAAKFLAPDATMFLEVGIDQADEVQDIFKTYDSRASTRAFADFRGILRYVTVKMNV